MSSYNPSECIASALHSSPSLLPFSYSLLEAALLRELRLDIRVVCRVGATCAYFSSRIQSELILAL